MGKEAEPKTYLYLLRHAATEANLARPARLQGRRQNPPLAPIGIRQAEATRDFLAQRSIQHCYTSPMLRAMQTATIVAAPHGLSLQPLESLTECDIGRWEGMDWQSIRYLDAEAYHKFMSNPALHGYPSGETFADVYNRVAPTIEELLRRHKGEGILVVAHHVVNRTYLASLMGLTPDQARQVVLDNCGISVVVCEGDSISVNTLNAAFHLHNVAA
jgi:broad specificity phosphatase PhoE